MNSTNDTVTKLIYILAGAMYIYAKCFLVNITGASLKLDTRRPFDRLYRVLSPSLVPLSSFDDGSFVVWELAQLFAQVSSS